MKYTSWSRKVFSLFNYLVMAILALLCLAPVLNAIAISLSGSIAVGAGRVTFWPVDFTMDSYRYLWSRSDFFTALWVTVKRVFIGTSVQMLITIITAFPLSMEQRDFRMRTVYVWFFVFTMLFSGGLVPWFLQVRAVGLLNSIWALVLPGAVSVWNLILMLNFFRRLPRELTESFFIDGANYHHLLWQLYVPLSKSVIATILLFTVVAHWNSWFDGLILMNHATNYPLATYLYTIVQNFDFSNVTQETAEILGRITTRSAKSAHTVVAMLPIICVYPFLQKYFVTGIVLGSVKG